jgi:hypothetical protein
MTPSSQSVQLTLNTYLSTLPKGQQAPSLEELQKLLETALIESGDGGPPSLVEIAPMHPGQSFSMSMAPQLMQPLIDADGLSVDTLMFLPQFLRQELHQQSMFSNFLRIQADSAKHVDYLEQQQEDNLEAMEAQAAARAAGATADATQTATLVLSVFAAVVTILAAILTGGLLVGLVAAAVGAMAGMEGATAVSRAVGGTREGLDGEKVPLGFTFTDLTRVCFEQDVRDGRIVIARQLPDGRWVDDRTQKPISDPTLGSPKPQIMSKEEYENRVAYLGLAVTLLFNFGTLAGGIGAALLPMKMQKIIQNVASLNKLLGTSASVKQVQMVANTVLTATSAVEAGSTVVDGGARIGLALRTEDVEKFKAALAHVKQLIDFVVTHMEQLQKATNKEREELQNTVLAIVRAIGQVHQGQVQIAHNITPLT